MPQPSPNNKQVSSQKKDALFLLAVPITVVLIAIALVYAPRLFAHPSYNFVYIICSQYSCPDYYHITEKGKLARDSQPIAMYNTYDTPGLYLYDATSNSSRRIDYSEAARYTLLESQTAPDGYQLTSDDSGKSLLFWNSHKDTETWYLAQGVKKKQLRIYSGRDGYNSVHLLGWVER